MEHDHLSQEESANSPFVVCSIYTKNSNVLDERRLIMDTKKIGAFIAMNRKKKGYTQEQLAEKLGVTNKTISDGKMVIICQIYLYLNHSVKN